MKFAATQFPNFCCLIAIAFYTADDRMAGDLSRRQLRKSECTERVWLADFVWSHFEVSIVEFGRDKIESRSHWFILYGRRNLDDVGLTLGTGL